MSRAWTIISPSAAIPNQEMPSLGLSVSIMVFVSIVAIVRMQIICAQDMRIVSYLHVGQKSNRIIRNI